LIPEKTSESTDFGYAEDTNLMVRCIKPIKEVFTASEVAGREVDLRINDRSDCSAPGASNHLAPDRNCDLKRSFAYNRALWTALAGDGRILTNEGNGR
jgi:hypothetical protein